MKRLAALLPFVLLSACTASEMKMPASLADSGERIVFDGFTGWTNGKFAAGEYRGTFHRGLERLGLFWMFEQTLGHSEFSIAGPGISPAIEGYCQVRDRAIKIDDVEFRPIKMAYRCDLAAEGRAIPAYFELQESRKGLAAKLSHNARRGEIALAGEVVQFRSVHRVEGSVVTVEDPIGYVFEQEGHALGALQLNGKPVLTLARQADMDQRRAVLVASVALATFWDPGAVDD